MRGFFWSRLLPSYRLNLCADFRRPRAIVSAPPTQAKIDTKFCDILFSWGFIQPQLQAPCRGYKIQILYSCLRFVRCALLCGNLELSASPFQHLPKVERCLVGLGACTHYAGRPQPLCFFLTCLGLCRIRTTPTSTASAYFHLCRSGCGKRKDFIRGRESFVLSQHYPRPHKKQ